VPGSPRRKETHGLLLPLLPFVPLPPPPSQRLVFVLRGADEYAPCTLAADAGYLLKRFNSTHLPSGNARQCRGSMAAYCLDWLHIRGDALVCCFVLVRNARLAGHGESPATQH